MMRRMGRTRREVDERRLLRRQGFLVLDPGHRLVGHVGHEVVVRVVGQFDHGRAVVQERRPLVRLAADEAVELVEALVGRPAVEGTGDAGFPCGRLVPLAERRRGIAIEPQGFGQRRSGVRNLAGGAGQTGRHLGDEGHVHRVVVASGLERRAGRRTQRGGVEVVVAQALLCQRIQGRHRDRATERRRYAEAHVVDQHDDDIGRALRRLDLEARRHFHVARIDFVEQRARRFLDRQDRAIEASPRDERGSDPRDLPSPGSRHAPAVTRKSTRATSSCRLDLRSKAPEAAPNVVIVLIDNLGFGVPTAFGGPVSMPTLEPAGPGRSPLQQLPRHGACSPTRAALKSGRITTP